MCVAALKAKEFSEVHLLTFYDRSTKDEPLPKDNADKLRQNFPDVQFRHFSINTDPLIRRISYQKYISSLLRFRLLNAATPAFSSLSWHLSTLYHCLDYKIFYVFDGMTREMIHLPGHMHEVLQVYKKTYQSFGMTYSSPVYSWEVPEDQEFIDRIVVDQHGFFFPSEDQPHKTTGQYLYEIGLFPHPNVKGSEYDRQMQHDCYPFVLYNILFFWFLLNFSSYEKICQRMADFVRWKTQLVLNDLDQGRRPYFFRHGVHVE